MNKHQQKQKRISITQTNRTNHVKNIHAKAQKIIEKIGEKVRQASNERWNEILFSLRSNANKKPN